MMIVSLGLGKFLSIGQFGGGDVRLWEILLIMYIFSCVDEPGYINTKRSDLPAPAIKYVEQQDAFSLLIKWYVLNQDDHLVDHFLIESFSSNDSLTMNQSLFDTEMADNPAAREIIINRNDSILAEMVTVLPSV